jgi:hypothetical protein
MNAFSGMSLDALTTELEYRRRSLTASGTRRPRRAKRSAR